MLGTSVCTSIILLCIASIFSCTSNAFLVIFQTVYNDRALLFLNPLGSTVSSRILTLCQVAANDSDEGEPKSGIEVELGRLQEQLSLIEALEARNKAQLDSFVDEDDQWNSMEKEERTLLKSKDSIVEKMEFLTEQMVMLWMGQKSQDG
jgi:hypothetical protein